VRGRKGEEEGGKGKQRGGTGEERASPGEAPLHALQRERAQVHHWAIRGSYLWNEGLNSLSSFLRIGRAAPREVVGLQLADVGA